MTARAPSFDAYPAYLGIPFSDLDRGRSGTHCHGLGRLILRVERQIEIADYGPARDWCENAARIAAGKAAGPWIDVSNRRRRPFDFVIYAVGRFDDHMGVVIDPTWMIHVQRGGLSQVDAIDDARFGRLSGVYRHEDLMTAASA